MPQFIEAIYFKRFHKSQTEVVQIIEDMIRSAQEKKAERKANKAGVTDISPGNDTD